MKFDPSIVQARLETPLGPMIVAATARGVAGIWFEQQKHLPDCSAWPYAPHHPVLREAQAQLRAYFAGERTTFDLPLDVQGGTPFQQAVWHALLAIPHGTTTTYREVGERAGRPGAMRAIGAAVGRNPLSIVVPCHRVLGSDGSLTGYAGGLERKRALLQLERAA
jgi:methylated-DNA-[protein]-cysteine S-methyltransferase